MNLNQFFQIKTYTVQVAIYKLVKKALNQIRM